MRELCHRFFDQRGGAIRTAVIDDEDFVSIGQSAQSRIGFGNGGLDTGFFIISRHDERKASARWRIEVLAVHGCTLPGRMEFESEEGRTNGADCQDGSPTLPLAALRPKNATPQAAGLGCLKTEY